MPNNYQELVQHWAAELTQYSTEEAENLVNWLLEHHLGLRRVDMMHFLKEEDLPEALQLDFERLKSGEPIQYILGKGPFYGREFWVNEHTLIPRNETEELVHLIIKKNPRAGLKILDIGTGTGCIPISLDLEMKTPEVYGIDISDKALEVARKNGESLKSNVSFLKCDILTEMPNVRELDILVSNPPYVPESEKSEMHRNVLDFEPGLALFVPDEDPLLFYKVIGAKGKQLLKPGGKLYFEIHEKFGSEIKELLTGLGYKDVKVVKDLNGKERIACARN
ncbi:MAG: peptide chain release factor N(5)-glutamine methyltransferase [Algoriphagus sp.]|nr:peptide chain release factor N(5)-glutamine methyltransferase [Algoriphagus sp.]